MIPKVYLKNIYFVTILKTKTYEKIVVLYRPRSKLSLPP